MYTRTIFFAITVCGNAKQIPPDKTWPSVHMKHLAIFQCSFKICETINLFLCVTFMFMLVITMHLCSPIDIIHSGDSLSVKEDVKMPVQGNILKSKI